jgi:hypothetical protein
MSRIFTMTETAREPAGQPLPGSEPAPLVNGAPADGAGSTTTLLETIVTPPPRPVQGDRLKAFFGRLRGRARSDTDSPDIVADSVDLIGLLAERGIELDQADVRTVMDANRNAEAGTWTAYTAAGVIAAYSRIAARARPATLEGLRYARRGGGKMSSIVLALVGLATLAAIIWLQAEQFRLVDVQRKIEAYRADLAAAVETGLTPAQTEDIRVSLNGQYLRLQGILPKIDADLNDRLAADTAGAIPVVSREQGEFLIAAASTWVAVLGTYLLPTLYGLLGSIASMLRSHSASVQSGTVTPSFTGEYSIRMILGMVAGLAIGLFVGADTAASGGFAALTPVALAFVAGYAVELLFGLVDRLVGAYSTRPEPEKPADGAAPNP